MLSRGLPLAVGWTVFGLVQAAFGAALFAAPADALVWLTAHELPLAWSWALATPVIGRWDAWLARRPWPAWGRVAAHLPALLAFALAHTFLRRALAGALGAEPVVGFDVTLLYYADVTVASWLAAVWAARALGARARLSERDAEAHRLEEQLLDARMESLELQLRPHVLFNVLGSVAELAHEAPRKAVRVLASLRVLLANAVRGTGSGPVPLAEEMEALAPYLTIQRLRFSDWLAIEEDVREEARGALVPRLVLQPLVENAVQHGLAGRTAPGRISIGARVRGDRLLVTVTDDGVGLARGGPRLRPGIGLANTRARLATLYGGNATLAVGDGPEGGTEARLDLPLRRAEPSPGVADAPHREVVPAEAGPPPPGGGRPDAPGDAWPLLAWARRRPWLALVTGWSLLALLRIQHSYAYLAWRDRYTAAAFRDAIRHDVAAAALWCALTPVVLAIARRIPLERGRLPVAIPLHALAAVGTAFAHALGTHALTGGDGLALRSPGYAQVYAWDVAVYAILVLVAHAGRLSGWVRERETETARLRRELAEARFRGAVAELRTPVLLGCLARLEELVERDARAAERGLAEIGDVLRATLERVHDEDVPLREELSAAAAYGRVLALAGGTGDGADVLHVTVDLPAERLGERVPRGILSALVDAVFDGTAAETAGRVAASSEAPAVEVAVAADGPAGLLLRARAAGGGDRPAPDRARLGRYVAHGRARPVEQETTAGALAVRVPTTHAREPRASPAGPARGGDPDGGAGTERGGATSRSVGVGTAP